MPAAVGVHTNVAIPLTNGTDALIGAPFSVKPAEPTEFVGKMLALMAMGTPTVAVLGALIARVPPVGVASTVSTDDVDAVALASPLYTAWKVKVPLLGGVQRKKANEELRVAPGGPGC